MTHGPPRLAWQLITTVFSPNLDSNRLDTLSLVFQVLSFKKIVLRWLIQLLSRIVCRVNIGDLRIENGESAYQVFTEEPQLGIHSLRGKDPDQRNF